MRKFMGVGVVMVAATLLAGCNSGGTSTVPASGTVTYNGAPLDGADVVFVSSAADGHNASARTDAEGKFTLKTYVNPDDQPEGIAVGEYTVTVTKVAASAGASSGGGSADPAQQMMEMMKAQGFNSSGEGPAGAKALVPAKYADAKSSDLKVTISEGGNTDIKLELKD